jgi:hypothetical protein
MKATLRELLHEMTHDGSAVDSHVDRLERLKTMVPHSIEVRLAPYDEPLGEFNCVMYALGLVARLEYAMTPLGRFYANLPFLRRLIESGVLRTSEPEPGVLVVWSSGSLIDGIAHVGVLACLGRAISKWGIGHVYEHGLLEVPTQYGEPLAYYAPLTSEDALERLKEYLS